MATKSSAKTKSSALRTYCRGAVKIARCPKCGGKWFRSLHDNRFVVCYDCVIARGLGCEKLRRIPEEEFEKSVEASRRADLLDLPEAVRKTRRGKFTLEGQEGVWRITREGEPGAVLAAVPWGDSNWRAKWLGRIEK